MDKTSQETLVRALVDLRDRTLQKARIAFGNRVAAIDNGADVSEHRELLQRLQEVFRDLEEIADKDITELVAGMVIVQDLCELKGIGFTLAAKLVSMIDIERQTRSPPCGAMLATRSRTENARSQRRARSCTTTCA